MSISTWIKKHQMTFIGAAIGAIGGFLYWKFVGCSSGTCPITSSPINSTLYGILIGALLGDSFKKKKNASKTSLKNKVMALNIIAAYCPANHACPAIEVCPTNAIQQLGYGLPTIDQNACTECCACVSFCHTGAIMPKR